MLGITASLKKKKTSGLDLLEIMGHYNRKHLVHEFSGFVESPNLLFSLALQDTLVYMQRC